MREKKTIGKTNEKETYMDGKKKKIERIECYRKRYIGNGKWKRTIKKEKEPIRKANERERKKEKGKWKGKQREEEQVGRKSEKK